MMASITRRATVVLAIPMNERGPVWSVISPTRADRSLELVIVPSSYAL